MSQLKLTYFDTHGGRAEPIRLALHLGGIAFEDFRFPFADFAEVARVLKAFVARPAVQRGLAIPAAPVPAAPDPRPPEPGAICHRPHR